MLEFPAWKKARSLSYSGQLGIEEGLHANNIQFFTITTPWLSCAKKTCIGKKFDQVWIEISHQEILDQKWREWILSIAPIRIGFLVESLEYHAEEIAEWAELKLRKQKAQERIQYMTHVVSCDEKDVENINAHNLVPAIWCPGAVPKRFIDQRESTVSKNYAVFSGAIYDARKKWLECPELKGLLVQQISPEQDTIYPFLFDTLHRGVDIFVRRRLPAGKFFLALYLLWLRYIRQKNFSLWLQGMKKAIAVVNLCSFVKGYSSRVVEGMAAGRPVISWDIPGCPRNRALFEDGKEILLYSENEPSQLAEHIRSILSKPEFARKIVANAQHKLRRFHTTEHRVKQILNWIENGQIPEYC